MERASDHRCGPKHHYFLARSEGPNQIELQWAVAQVFLFSVDPMNLADNELLPELFPRPPRDNGMCRDKHVEDFWRLLRQTCIFSRTFLARSTPA